MSCPSFAVKDVTACKRFYRDQCLHGLAVPNDPGDPAINRCVEAIRLAGKCAAGDPACTQLPEVTPATTTACELIQHPELATDCRFLAPAGPVSTAPTLPSGGAGGAAGASGAAGGSAGTEAAAGTSAAAGSAGAGGGG